MVRYITLLFSVVHSPFQEEKYTPLSITERFTETPCERTVFPAPLSTGCMRLALANEMWTQVTYAPFYVRTIVWLSRVSFSFSMRTVIPNSGCFFKLDSKRKKLFGNGASPFQPTANMKCNREINFCCKPRRYRDGLLLQYNLTKSDKYQGWTHPHKAPRNRHRGL